MTPEINPQPAAPPAAPATAPAAAKPPSRLDAALEKTRRDAQARQTSAEQAKVAETYRGPGPSGAGEHVVQDGECISSIAKQAGHLWRRIWNDAGNTSLREVRRDPNVLLPGDRVAVPPITPKHESGQSEMRHRFVRRGEPATLRLRLMHEDTPRANQPYTIEIDGRKHSGFTDAEGKLEAPIPGNARRGRLLIGPAEAQEEFPLNLGQVDPIAEVSGIQGRLNNLGFGCGPADGVLGPQTRSAIQRFQETNKLQATGLPDDVTRAKLVELHGS